MFRRIWFICGFIYSTMSSYAAIDIIFDYSYDTGNYFGDEQRYIMEQVAYVFESRMGGTSFSGYRPNEDLGLTTISNAKLYFDNPTTDTNVQPGIGSTTSDGNVIGRQDELIIFLGARSFGFSSSSVLASAAATGRSGFSGSSTDVSAFSAALDAKDSTTNWEPLAGVSQVNSSKSFYFDTDLTTHADATSSGLIDFYSVMVHEVGHIMGFTSSANAWSANTSGNFWTGANAKAEYNNQNIPLYSTPHWDLPTDGTPGNTGSLNPAHVNCACHPSMLPSGGPNERTSFSDLDFALLKDIGYSISASPVGANIGGTYTDPTWGGTYDIPVSMSYNDWLAGGNGGNGAGGGGGGGGGGGSAAPEPAYIFTLMGGLLAFLGGRKNLGKLKTLLRIA
jgi:hypothetical protein